MSAGELEHEWAGTPGLPTCLCPSYEYISIPIQLHER